MKRIMLGFAILLFAPFARADSVDLGDLRLALIDDPVRIEFQAGVTAPSMDRMRQTIAIIAGTKDWKVAAETEGRTELMRLVRGTHMVKVAVTYDQSGCRIRYLQSDNLLYKELQQSGAGLRAIHKNYNGWVRQLAAALAGGFGVPTRTAFGFAPLDRADAVPFLGEGGRAAYKEFLSAPAPRAFALAPNGAFGWYAPVKPPSYYATRNIIDPVASAMERCNRRGDGACKLYAVDERVVWYEP